MSEKKTTASLRDEADELMTLMHSQLNRDGKPLSDEEFTELLDGWVRKASNKLVACRQAIASCAARRDSYENEIEAFAMLVEREGKAIDRINDYALMLLDKELEVLNATSDDEVDKVKLPDGSWAKLYRGKGRLVSVTNWDMLPKEFVVSRADKAAIRDAIKAGHTVPGAEVVESHKPARVQWGGRKRS